jgi:hypothetical protein
MWGKFWDSLLYWTYKTPNDDGSDLSTLIVHDDDTTTLGDIRADISELATI